MPCRVSGDETTNLGGTLVEASHRVLVSILLGVLSSLWLACPQQQDSKPSAPSALAEPEAAESPPVQVLMEQAATVFGPLPAAPDPGDPIAEARVELGRLLYYDPRLSKNQDISCNSCHMLDRFGVDGEPTSPGHKGQRGARNSPTTLNASLHLAQFWDGRAADVEEQATGPVLNPVEMALPSEEHVTVVLESIPGYVTLFAAAFPEADQPTTLQNAGIAIGAFERGLLTPAAFDRFMQGEAGALTAQQQRGLQTFIATGCITCHNGPAVGGAMYQKLGLVNAYETGDPGRFEVTGQESDRYVFKVPSLRNVAETGPWFHDGSVTSLDEVVRLMAWHQLGRQLEAAQVRDIVAFLGALTGSVDAEYVAVPELPEGTDATPAPDPS
jgi:cytochrome c peroxidase